MNDPNAVFHLFWVGVHQAADLPKDLPGVGGRYAGRAPAWLLHYTCELASKPTGSVVDPFGQVCSQLSKFLVRRAGVRLGFRVRV